MSVIKHKAQRVAVFIDTQNLYHSAKNLYQANVNFGKLVESAVDGRALVRAIAYVITTESGEEAPFFEALTKAGIETKTKDLQIFAGGAKKADWDVGLAVDAIKQSGKVDAVIIASGDGDYVPLVEYLQTHAGCQVEAISFGRSSSQALKDAVDDFIDMDADKKTYLMMNYRNKRGRTAARSKTKKQTPKLLTPEKVKRVTKAATSRRKTTAQKKRT